METRANDKTMRTIKTNRKRGLHEWIVNSNLAAFALRIVLLAGVSLLFTGCAAVTVHHVPKIGAMSAAKMSDLHGTQPIDVKGGESSPEETKIGTVGMGKVMGKLSEWTGVAVGAVRTNLSTRGATVTDGAAKTLTITMTKAEVSAIPVVGVSNGKIVLTATTSAGFSSSFEGSSSSLAPLSAVDGAVADAIKKLLADSAVDAYLRK